jgi:hypothetical protein
MARRPVNHVRDAAVAGDTALVRGFAAWFIGRLLEDAHGGLEVVLARSGVAPERRADVLRAHAALVEVGSAWRLAQAASASGTAAGDVGCADVRSELGTLPDLLGSRDVASALGVTDRRVRALAQSGLLRGRTDPSGRWWFDSAAVEAELQRRSRGEAA